MKKKIKLSPVSPEEHITIKGFAEMLTPGITLYSFKDLEPQKIYPPCPLGKARDSWEFSESFEVRRYPNGSTIEIFHPVLGDLKLRVHREDFKLYGKNYQVVTAITIEGYAVHDLAVVPTELDEYFRGDGPIFGIASPLSDTLDRYLRAKLLELHLHDRSEEYEDFLKRQWKLTLGRLRLFYRECIRGSSTTAHIKDTHADWPDYLDLYDPVYKDLEQVYEAFSSPEPTMKNLLAALNR